MIFTSSCLLGSVRQCTIQIMSTIYIFEKLFSISSSILHLASPLLMLFSASFFKGGMSYLREYQPRVTVAANEEEYLVRESVD